MSLINLTAHPVSFFDKHGNKVVVHQSGEEARCTIKDDLVEYVTAMYNGRKMEIPVFRSHLTQRVTGLPPPMIREPGEECSFCGEESCGDQKTGIRNCENAPRYIVSRVIVDALPERSDLYSPYDLIRENRVVIGAKALSKF